MTRAHLWLLNIFLAVTVIATAWWAMNAPRVARPLPTVLGEVDLPKEKPPLPPAPYAWAPRESADGVGRRPIFAHREKTPDSAATIRPSYPLAQTVPPPLAAAPRRDMDEPPRLKSPSDPFGFARQIDPPKHSQYFGGHLLSPDQRKSDLNGKSSAKTGLAPKYAPKPERNPRRGKPATPKVASPTPTSKPPKATPPKPSRPTAETVADAATSKAAPGASEVEGMILLGVFRSRGADRALVRKPNGSSVRVEQGDEIEGWRVYAIGDAFVELRRSSQSRMLRMPR